METYPNLETAALDKMIESGKPVRLIFTTGYQCLAVIEDYDCDVIRCRVKRREADRVTEQKWIVYRNGLSTIAQE